MVLLCPRIHFYEITDLPWFPPFLRARIQSCLTLLWELHFPILQERAPARLVAETLMRILDDDIKDYTFVDFCSGAGGPTPWVEREVNKLVEERRRGNRDGKGRDDDEHEQNGIAFILTDLHPHIADWTVAARRSRNLYFEPRSIDAANAPADLGRGAIGDGKGKERKVFRLYSLAFHHFDDELAGAIIRNTMETADGFAIFELQSRTLSSLLTILAMGLLILLITPFYFWRSPSHLFFTYVIPIIPVVLVFDGLVSSLRTRSAEEVGALMDRCGGKGGGWRVRSGEVIHTWPTGWMGWVVGTRG